MKITQASLEEAKFKLESLLVEPANKDESLDQFREFIRSTAFHLTLSQRMCAALIALYHSKNCETAQYSFLAAVFLQKLTKAALTDRGLLEGWKLTRAGEIVAQLAEMAGFEATHCGYGIDKNGNAVVSSTEAFREYVRSAAFCLSLSIQMCVQLLVIRQGKFASDEYRHWLKTLKSLQSRGLVWHDASAPNGGKHKLTKAGELVAELVEIAGLGTWEA